MEEIESVRKRRENREKELEEMERLRDEEQRLREMASLGEWQKKEEEFHMEQTRFRSKIRLVENREETIDLIAKNILLLEAVTSPEVHDLGNADLRSRLSELDSELRDPVTLIEDLSERELENLLGDIEQYTQLESIQKGPYIRFWESLRIVVSTELKKCKSKSGKLHKAVTIDVEKLFRGKNAADLDSLETDIASNISKKVGDVEYWEQMAQEIALQKAKVAVNDIHQELLRKQVEYLSRLRVEVTSSTRSERAAAAASTREEESEDLMMLRSEQSKGMEDSEQQMEGGNEIFLPSATYWWQDRYRPRKPRYFNRVRTGWDWNKYNQTHYDRDNPPPKTIQGYKFTLFYPDLIDKTKTPKYFLEPADEDEFAIIRFHAGPPYEDVAFKILNKEWDVNKRAGFRCLFERGVLQLHFNFKRHFYRR